VLAPEVKDVVTVRVIRLTGADHMLTRPFSFIIISDIEFVLHASQKSWSGNMGTEE
jgi:hypothetical protein